MAFFRRIIDYFVIPVEAKDTFKFDLQNGISKGFVLAGSASVAGVILKKTFSSSDFEVALLHSSVSLGLLFSIFLASHSEKPNKMDYVYYPDMIARWLFILIALVSVFLPFSIVFTLVLCAAFAFNSVNTPVVTSIYRSNYPDHSRGKIMGVVRTFFNIAFVAASYLFSLMLDMDGHNYIYVYPIIGLVGIWGAMQFRKIKILMPADVSTSTPLHPLIQLRRVLKNDKPFAYFMWYWAIFGFAALMVDPVKTIFVTDPIYAINASYEEAILAVTVIPQAVMLLTFAFWGKQIDKYGVIKIRFILNILPTINLLLFYFATDLNLIYIASVLQGVSMSGAQLSWQLCVMEFAPKNQVGIYMGIHTMLTGIRGIIAPFVGAYLIGAAGIGNTFLVGFVLMLISTIMMIRFAKNKTRHDLQNNITREFVPKPLAG
ncbi:MFS transporter [bacterium]|nr:MFS transporter [bacterium]